MKHYKDFIAVAEKAIARTSTGEAAWRLREDLLERDPVLALRSVRGLDDERSRALLGDYASLAPKIVLRSLTGNGSDFAHDLRRQLEDTGREVIDSLGWLDDEASMALREAHAERWSSTVLGSLSRVSSTPRVDALIEQCQRHGAGDVHVLRQLALREESPQRPEWARRDESGAQED